MTVDDRLAECLSQLLPAGDLTRSGAVLALPNARDPRLFVPVSNRRSAAQALAQRYGGGSLRQRAKAAALATAVRSGLSARLPLWRADLPRQHSTSEFHAWLSALIGAPYRVSLVFVGPRRANRKPVVFVTDLHDRLIAVVKVGYNEVTAPLVRYEATALASVADALAEHAHTPSLLGAARIGTLEAMAMRPLPAIDGNRAVKEEGLVVLVRNISDSGDQPRDDLSSLLEHTRMQTLASVATAIDEALADTPVGAIHGDFHRGNLGVAQDGRPVVWDWERWADGIPRGFDLLHYTLQTWVHGDGAEPEAAARRLINTASELLAPLEIRADAAADVARDYLIRLAARYVGDAQDKAGSKLGLVEKWLFPAVLD